MDTFLKYFDAGWKIYIAGIVSYPIAKYLLTRYGGAAWEDVKKVAYKLWEQAKILKFWK